MEPSAMKVSSVSLENGQRCFRDWWLSAEDEAFIADETTEGASAQESEDFSEDDEASRSTEHEVEGGGLGGVGRGG